MMPFFTTPWALLGLLGLPALVAIYWLRRRPRRIPVSSLMLWAGQKDARAGGLRLQRLQTPLLFFLELLAILLLAGAAAGPHLLTGKDPRPLIVVLDDSYSMRAGGSASPREEAVEAVLEELRRRPRSSVRFIRAAPTPRVLGGLVQSAAEAQDLLDGWKCRAPSAALDRAVALAGDLGGTRALILVVTDQAPAPTSAPGAGRLRWWAFGRPRSNLAFVNAARTRYRGQDRCLLEVANLGPERQTARLLVDAGTPARSLRRSTLTLGAGETRRLVLRVKADTPAIRARLPGDALEVDNQVTLLPKVRRPVRVAVPIRDRRLRDLVEKALRATGRTVPAAVWPDLWFMDGAGDAPASPEAWRVRLLVEKDAEGYTGPFVVDRTHPLTEGLSLQGVIWGAGKTDRLAGVPIIMAGNIPLVADTESLTGRHDLTLRLRPDFSTLQHSPAWPVLVWNLVQWRAGQGPDLERTNVRLGEEVALRVAAGESVEVVSPDGTTRALPVHAARVVIPAEEVGLYQVLAPEGKYVFACNALDREESDLTACASGRWGEWTNEAATQPGSQTITWALLLFALVTLTVHTALGGK